MGRLVGLATCNVQVRFSPTMPANYTGTLSLTAGPGGTVQIPLTGRGYIW